MINVTLIKLAEKWYNSKLNEASPWNARLIIFQIQSQVVHFG